MRSFTSSFKNELKAFAVVLGVLGSLDIAQRFIVYPRIPDAVLLNSFPAVADRLETRKGPTVLLLGNSLTRFDYNMPLLDYTLATNGDGDVHVDNCSLSGANPMEWYHVFQRDFVRRGKLPTAIVIGMSPTGISDELPAGYRVGWLANETDWRDVPEVLFDDLKNVEIGGQYLQSRVSMLYANRWDIRVGLLGTVVPDIWDGMNWVNAGQIVHQPPPGQEPPPKTYSLLTRLLESAKESHVHVILFAMPAREPYKVDEALKDLLAKYQAKFLDCQEIPGLTISDFKDGWHLKTKDDGGEGADKFTAWIAGPLAQAVKSFQTTTQPRP